MKNRQSIHTLMFLVVELLCGHIIYSQTVEEFKSKFYSDTINIYMIGENHIRPNSSYKFKVLESIYQNCGINTVFLEVSKDCQVSVDKFLIGGVSDIEEISKNYVNAEDIMDFLSKIRDKYLVDIHDGKLRVVCMDISWFKSPVKELDRFLNKFPRIESLQELISEQKKNHLEKEMFFQKIQLDMKNNINAYRDCLGIYCDLFSSIIKDNITIYSNHSFFSDESTSYREGEMCKFILENMDANRLGIGLVFTGADHLLDTVNSWGFFDENGFAIPSLYVKLKQSLKFNILRINISFVPIEFYRIKRFWFPENLIDKNFFLTHEHGMIYLDKVENIPRFDKSVCDYVIIIDRRGR